MALLGGSPWRAGRVWEVVSQPPGWPWPVAGGWRRRTAPASCTAGPLQQRQAWAALRGGALRAGLSLLGPAPLSRTGPFFWERFLNKLFPVSLGLRVCFRGAQPKAVSDLEYFGNRLGRP